MNADQLRSLQTPLEDRYRAQPERAHITLRALCVVHQTLARAPSLSVARRVMS
ncbi:MAG: hypothetical protein HS128_23820 [Ideonella sp.]|nr:hypothetical protein [Ideonella sp.]MCC7455628.1 hypothetical protein [Nitrospira sp.]